MTQKSLSRFYHNAIKRCSFQLTSAFIDKYFKTNPFTARQMRKEVEVDIYWALEDERRRVSKDKRDQVFKASKAS